MTSHPLLLWPHGTDLGRILQDLQVCCVYGWIDGVGKLTLEIKL